MSVLQTLTTMRVVQEEANRVEAKIASACGDVSSDESLSMPLSSMAGTFIIAVFVQLIALGLGGFEYVTGRTVQDWLVRT